MKRILLVIIVTVLAVAGFTIYNKYAASTQPAEEESEEAQHTEASQQTETNTLKDAATAESQGAATAQGKGDGSVVKATGTLVLHPQNMGEVTSLMGGIVKTVCVKDGQQVSKGQVVATVENTDVVSLQREYFSAFKESQMAQTELERQQTLAQSGAGVKKNLQQAEKQCQVARATLTGIARQLAQMGISTQAVARGQFTTTFPLHAPISGTVSQLTASVGSYADMQTPLMQIRNNHAVECDLNVFEKDIHRIATGNSVKLSLTNQPGQTITGHVVGMNQYFNEGTKSVAVHVRLDNTQGLRLFDGMYVSGEIMTGKAMQQH